jgi:hypothetical protein
MLTAASPRIVVGTSVFWSGEPPVALWHFSKEREGGGPRALLWDTARAILPSGAKTSMQTVPFETVLSGAAALLLGVALWLVRSWRHTTATTVVTA